MTGPAAPAEAGAGTLQDTRRLTWLLVLPVAVLLAVLTALQYRQSRDDAERELLRRAAEHAQDMESVARQASSHVRDLAQMLQARWHDPPDSGDRLARALTPRRQDGAIDGWSLDGAAPELRERFGQVWHAEPGAPPPPAPWLRRAQVFVEQARIVHQRVPEFVATWFAAAEVNMSFGYPFVETSRMLSSMGQPSLQAMVGPRRAGVQSAQRALAADPNDVSFWGLPYVSQLDGELVMSHGQSVLVDGVYRGEVSVDFRLDQLQERAQRWRSGQARVWVVDARRHVLADSAQPLSGPRGPGQADQRVLVPLTERLPPGLGLADLDASMFAPDRVRHGDGWVLVSAVRIGSPWTYVEAVPAAQVRAQVLPSLVPHALLALVLLGVFVAGPWLVTSQFVEPALAVLDYLRELSRDPATPAPRLKRRWRGFVDAVTEVFRQQREAQRRERRVDAFKSAVIDHAPTAIVTTDGDGRIVEFNTAAEAMFGVRRLDVLGQPLGDVIIPPRHRAAHRAEMARLRAGERVAGFDRPLQMVGHRHDGREFPVEMLAFHLQVEGEDFYTGFISDLTSRQEAALQIERQRDALRQSEKLTAMGSLLAGVAHELNNPLAIVMGRASLLEEKTEGTPAAADAQRIREAAERCGRIVRTFLNMARQRPTQRSAVQVNDIVRAAAEMLGYTLRSHGIELQLALSEELPEVQADGDQIGQVVLNLMVNAQQALATHEGARRIVLATGREERRPGREPRVWLRVSDSGPGVPAALREEIFEPFFTTKAEGIGTGMGLAVSRSIVREHGGDLVLMSTPGDGAQFRVSLPISGAAPPPPPAPEVAAPEDLHSRVLVVDDEPEIADVMRMMLEEAGYEVSVAESGAVALEMLEMARFDAVVSDLRMPDIDGAALWREVTRRWPALAARTLFVTGDALSPGARQFLDDAGARSLEKPFAKAELLAAVREVLAH